MQTISRNRIFSVLAISAAMLAAPLAANAKPDMHASGARHGHQQEMAQRHGGHGNMLRALDLSQEQQDQIFKIRHTARATMYEQSKAVRSARSALREASGALPFDAAKAQAAADSLGQAQAQLALARAEVQAQINAVLSPEQRDKLAQKRSSRPHAKNSAAKS